MLNFRTFVENRAAQNLMLIAATVEARLSSLGYFSDPQYNTPHANEHVLKGVDALIEFRMQPPGMNMAHFVRRCWVPGVPPSPIDADVLENCRNALRDAAQTINHTITEHLRSPYAYPPFLGSEREGKQLVRVKIGFLNVPQVIGLVCSLTQNITLSDHSSNKGWREEENPVEPEKKDGK